VRIGLTSAARVNPYATLLIDELQKRDLQVDYVLSAERGPVGDLWERLKRRGVAGALRAVRHRASAEAEPLPLAKAAWERGLNLGAPLADACECHGIERSLVGSLSSASAAAVVRSHGTDVLINAGGGLFRQRLLKAPKLGLLNAHMARLPDLRGVDVLEWSVLLGIPLGITVHWIDGGIDTGDSLQFSPLSPQAGDTLTSLRERAVLLSASTIADQVLRLAAKPDVSKEQEGDGESGPADQFFALHPRLRERAASRLAARFGKHVD
jgi:folate-dependent phosphoribosylglycinamide formyltransferase PurN